MDTIKNITSFSALIFIAQLSLSETFNFKKSHINIRFLWVYVYKFYDNCLDLYIY